MMNKKGIGLTALIAVIIVTLVVGFFAGSNLGIAQLAPPDLPGNTDDGNNQFNNQQGQVVLMGTPGIFPDNDPILRTDFFRNHGNADVRSIRYIQPNMTRIESNTSRACFDMKYYNGQKIRVSPDGVATSLCLGIKDNAFVIEVLKLSELPENQGRAIISAPRVPY